MQIANLVCERVCSGRRLKKSFLNAVAAGKQYFMGAGGVDREERVELLAAVN